MQVSAVLAVIVVASLVADGEAFSKCDDKIRANIKKAWGTKTPTGILDKIKSVGKETVVGTTKGYLDEAAKKYFPQSKNPEFKCAFGIFKDGKYEITVVPSEGQSKTASFEIKAEDGKTEFETANEVQWRYRFFDEDGVTALYTCNNEGADSDSTPDGLIKVREGYKKEAVEKAKAKAKEVGLDISVVYPDTCQA